MKMASVVPLPGRQPNCISLMCTISWIWKLHDLICELEITIVATVKSFTLALIKVQNEALPVCWDHITAENSLCQLSCQLSSFLTSMFQHLSYDARWPSCFAAFHFAECFADQGRGYVWRGASSWRDLRELVAWPLKFNIEQPSIVLNPCSHLVFVGECKLTSITHSSHQQCPGLCGPFFYQYRNAIIIWGYCGEFLFLCLSQMVCTICSISICTRSGGNCSCSS